MAKFSKEFKIGIHNRFDVEVVDVATGEIKQKARAFNVVLNNYYSVALNWPENHPSSSTIAVGGGTGTPSPSDTALFQSIGNAQYNASLYGSYNRVDASRVNEGVISRQLKNTIPNDALLNTTITEMGLIANGTLVTHAMLQDMNGNPISINHTATDVINIICTIYLHFDPTAPVVNYNNYVGDSNRAGGATYFWALLMYTAMETSSPGYWSYPAWGNGQGNLWTSYLAFGKNNGTRLISPVSFSKTVTRDIANRTLTMKFAQVGISQANVEGGIGTIINCVGKSYGYDVGNEIVIFASNTPYTIESESVGVGDGSTTKFKTKFDKPYAATVYVNGVAQTSGVTVSKTPRIALTGNSGTICNYLKERYSDNINAMTDATSIQLKNSRVVENTLYPALSIGQVPSGTSEVLGSNDGVNWTACSLTTSGSYKIINDIYKYYKTSDGSARAITAPNNHHDGYNIVFDTAPAQGDVITIDYTTDYIPKDTDHVLDVEFTFVLGEYSGS